MIAFDIALFIAGIIMLTAGVTLKLSQRQVLEADLLERELDLRERELQLREQELAARSSTGQQL